jgi:hypothetical protein
MTPNHDHATLFVAPTPPPATGTAGEADPAVDHGDEAMRRLRRPFAVRGVPETGSQAHAAGPEQPSQD